MKKNRKRYWLTLVLLAGFYPAFTQNVIVTDSSDVDSLYTKLNPENIHTGYLADKAINWTDPTLYNGNSDSVINLIQWQQLYVQMYNSAVSNSTLLAPDTLRKKAYHFIDSTGIIPVVLLNMRYNYILPYAHDSGWIGFRNNSYVDTAGAHPSPFGDTVLFAATLWANKISSDSVSIELPSIFYFSNYNRTPAIIEIDINDGNGYNTIELNTIYKIKVPFGGLSFKIRCTFTRSFSYYSSSKTGYSTCPAASYVGLPPWPYVNPYQISATIPYNGHIAQGNAYIYYGKDNHNQLKDLLLF